MPDRNSPLGVLDSGIGGFTAVRQVQRLMPGEDVIYFGDGANVPYGGRSREEIVSLARSMFRFMEERGVKALLVACNTISCVLDQCRDAVSCPVFSAVEAGAEAAAASGAERIGVISTVFTHTSGCYREAIVRKSPRAVVVLSCGCPDLADLVEHSLGDPAGMARVEENLRQEMDGLVLEDRVDCCVLGCTHYPLVEDSIRRLYPGLELIDPAREMAASVKTLLEERDLLKSGGSRGRLDIFTTGDREEYALRAAQAGLRTDTVTWHPPLTRGN